MLRATGEGKVEIDPQLSGPEVLQALLYNFDFDDMKVTKLKPTHEQFLNDRVVPLLENDRGQIWLEGSASQIGKVSYNQTLSQVRVDRVVAHLRGRGVRDTQMQPHAVGNSKTAGHGADEERDRSVAITVHPRAIDTPKPPVLVPPKPAVSTAFSISMLTGISVSKMAKVIRILSVAPKYAKYVGYLTKLMKGKVAAGVAVDFIFFLIWDTTNNLACLYLYIGGGAGAGVTHFPPISATSHGPWNPFTTSAPISSAQFGG